MAASKKKPLIVWRLSNWRRLTQVVTILLFLYLLYEIKYPWEVAYKPTQYLRFDPLVNIFGLIVGIGLITGGMFIVIFILSLIFNRSLCGWLCPVGALLDGWTKLLVKPIKGGRVKLGKRAYGWKFIILNSFLLLALFGIPLLWLWEPMSLLPRSVTTIFFPPFNSLMAWSSQGLRESGNLLTLARYINNNLLDPLQPYFIHTLLMLIVLAIPFALEFRYSRGFCRILCPLGALMGYSSPFAWIRKNVDASCTECLACKRDCRMEAIYNSGRDYNPAECILCGDCIDVCPVRAVSFGVRPGFDPKLHQAITESNVEPTWKGGRFSLSRRAFVGSFAVGLISVPFLKSADDGVIRPEGHLRPPGSVPEDEFMKKCLKCGACIKVCPTHGLQPSLMETGFAGLFTPHLVPVLGECEYACNSCGLVCPSGAIEPIEMEDKQFIPIGIAYFKRDLCIPTALGDPCQVCEEFCPTPVKSILMREELVVTKDMEEKLVPVPYIVEETCIGCGVCERACPVVESPAVKTIYRGEQRGEEDLAEYRRFREEFDANRKDLPSDEGWVNPY